MESNSANVPSTKGSTGVEAAGKAGERETNAPNLFKAPQAAEEQETNAPCPRETTENTGTRETNVSEKDTAAARRDGGPPAARNSSSGRKLRRSTNHPTRFRRRRPSRPSHRQQVRILVMGQKPEGVGPIYPMPPKPECQQARLAGVVRPVARDACDAS
jgi:hypothetical protein